MKKALKVIGKVLLGILVVIVLFLAATTVYHRVMLKKEAPLREPVGQLVEVDGHNMNIYTEGEGEHTIVFMSGFGTPSPVMDFRSLYKLLSGDYRIVVIEKFGYGFSDIVDGERSFDTILRQDREALDKAGIKRPFILCPHSMSGVEALRWAQLYPDEVEAIVGLDMALPNEYKDIDLQSTESLENIAYIMNGMGLNRLADEKALPALDTGTLTREEKDIYKAVFFSMYMNKTMRNECDPEDTINFCDAIENDPQPDIPILLFVSDGTGGTGHDKEVWRGYVREYAARLPDAEIIELDCGHYVHNIEQDKIAADMREFIEDLD